ncbi:hypothetical protein HUJ04_006366 [Dendroctonus ponderosae]|nr:hypothetical protein HUJ04_006366 [Dendroctonus ponderosae]
MLIGEVTQSNRKVEKKNVEERIVIEGMTLFKKQKEEARRRKVAEQQEMREMMERYWPWERATDAKPRGLRNLRLEELFPNKDYQSAKRFVDRLVEEKKQKQLKEKLLEAENEQRNGWSSEDTLMNLEKAALAQKLKDKKKSCILSRKDSAYLKELTQQMVNKRQQVQKLKSVEEETSRRHFSTWESFWGKPGHGAPRSAVKKGSIERLLYPQMVPIGALSDLENEGNSENSDDTEERNVERANASAITIVEDDFSASPPSSADNSLQSSSITTIEQSPLDPLKDAENIITSASNSFSTEGLNEPRSISKDSESHKGLDVSVNSVYNSEPTKSGRVTLVEKFSDEKAVDEPPFIQTYVKPLEQEANSEKGDLQKATEKPMEASTEENEAKVEQVQFFSAPLVAAFTVHQDETGHPNKVEPIYKNDNNIQPLMEPVNSVELSPVLSRNSFNSLSLQQKQQLLEQELQQLRVQQQQLFARNNFAAGSQVLSQTGFNQAINQNFNQLDPVFTEPDRSIVTKLASIDPNNLLAETADPFLSRFMPNEAIVPVVSAAQSLVNSNHPVDVSFTSSISFDPLAEAGKLPENAQILPVKEPTGFHKLQSFIQPSQPLSGKEASLGGGNFATSAYLRQEAEAENQNRILRQELGTANLGFNQNSFSIVPAQQPVPPKHELGYFPENSQFPGQNELSSFN